MQGFVSYTAQKREEPQMKDEIRMLQSGVVLALLLVSSACVVEPRENYYDRDHHRYYHDHVWHDCADRDEHCR
jgi:hypothetical protein